VPHPYQAVARQLGLDEAEVLGRVQALLDLGVIRRIGAVPNHYAIGYAANGMSVWDVCDEQADRLGEQVGALAFVTHCYRRPRHLPEWPYNLFAMLHGATRGEVREQAARIETLLGEDCRGHDILFSTQILKKTGLRLTA
jgi:DNA-binding Lrp family transcriptional regulator